jgi:glycosyltransferase involved in cell wall biosynthesis
MRKILLIAPVATHPSTTGASTRVRHMAESLLSMGHEVHFLLLQQPLLASDAAMHAYWKDRFHVFRGLSPASCLRRGVRKLLRVTAKTFHLNLAVDSYFDPAAGHDVQALFARHAYDVVIVSYVFYSRLFESMPSSVLKLLDTHDVFADRYQLYRAHRQAGEFFSTARAEEGKALDRADTVLAIQGSDARHFRSVSATPVAVVGHLLPPTAGAEAGRAGPRDPAVLFVGGPMGINVHGVTWFIEQVLPLLRRRVPQVELWLVGGIGDRFRGDVAGVRRLGFVERLDELYGQVAAVINPQRFGTGLSIKSVEAMAHGAPLVATVTGARGLEEGAGTAFLQADTPEAFSECLIGLLRDPVHAETLAARGAAFAGEYYRRNVRALAAAVNGASPP